MDELVAACKEHGFWPFTHFNTVHVVPPLNTPPDEVALGLEILDDVLALADRRYGG